MSTLGDCSKPRGSPPVRSAQHLEPCLGAAIGGDFSWV